MPPIDPPTTAYHRSMPSASASATSSATWSRIVVTGKREPERPAVRRRAGRRAGRALAPTEHVGAHDEEAVGVDGAPGTDGAVPPADVAVPRPRGAGGVAVEAERVQHEHRVRRVGRELAPRLVRDRHVSSRPPASSFTAVDRTSRTAGGRGSSPGRHAPVTGKQLVDRRGRTLALGGAEAGVEVGEDVVDRLDAHREAHEVGRDAGGGLLVGDELLVGGGGRVDREAAHVAHVGEVAVQLERVDELLARLEPALDAERDDGALRRRAGTSSPARATGSTPGRGRSPSSPRRGLRATAPPPARSASAVPCAATASRGPAGTGTS